MQIGEAGAVPLLVNLLAAESSEAQDCAVGAVANMSANARCRELITDADGIEPLVMLLTASSVGLGVQEMAVLSLTNLACMPDNQVASCDATPSFV